MSEPSAVSAATPSSEVIFNATNRTIISNRNGIPKPSNSALLATSLEAQTVTS